MASGNHFVTITIKNSKAITSLIRMGELLAEMKNERPWDDEVKELCEEYKQVICGMLEAGGIKA